MHFCFYLVWQPKHWSSNVFFFWNYTSLACFRCEKFSSFSPYVFCLSFWNNFWPIYWTIFADSTSIHVPVFVLYITNSSWSICQPYKVNVLLHPVCYIFIFAVYIWMYIYFLLYFIIMWIMGVKYPKMC
jgi:hypothetical protein